MISPALYLVFLLTPTPMHCHSAKVLLNGETAPCTGILISEQQSRKYLSCLRVDLPKQRADFELMKSKLTAEADALRVQLAVSRTLIESSEPDPPWLLPVVIAGSVVAGVLVGGFVVGAIQ